MNVELGELCSNMAIISFITLVTLFSSKMLVHKYMEKTL